MKRSAEGGEELPKNKKARNSIATGSGNAAQRKLWVSKHNVLVRIAWTYATRSRALTGWVPSRMLYGGVVMHSQTACIFACICNTSICMLILLHRFHQYVYAIVVRAYTIQAAYACAYFVTIFLIFHHVCMLYVCAILLSGHS